ncbi:methionine--tRNA ligase, mitochondrial [Toxorhynchites rutilus septentrionalis]|uniref:methionine--tRNA ligase, mitochondrial n=1 Tax=Toxorhynchites rutilus septentrionalis TaxID=329112 RepID=UPI00247AE318|nr:methionine--tRNA ligase, mitochondrial [Toxorhynchites rutilus septentrionalis]
MWKNLHQIRAFRSGSNDRFSFVTTPIFYVNAAPHIGHLYSAIIADAIHRFNVLTSPAASHLEPPIFSTGTDEHGTKIQLAAQAHAVPVATYCGQISDQYRKLFRNFGVDYTRFIRTTDPDHVSAVQCFWQALERSGSVYSANYAGWYCVPDETFLTDSQLKENDSGVKVSVESGHPVEWTEETNYMFKLNRHQDDVLYWIKHCEDRIVPLKFRKICLDFLQEPLPDISISRPKSRVSWGVEVPSDSTQSVYVWLDALVNYLTVTGFPHIEHQRCWPPTVQVLGKDILKFHGIYWPAFLIAARLEPPKQLLVHSHWTVDNQKMSKSKLNVVDPNERAALYTHEGMRYFLLREGVAHSDGNYSDTKIIRILNAELADTLGNLLSRCCGKALNPEAVVPSFDQETFQELKSLDTTKRLLDLLQALPEKCHLHYREYNFYLVVDSVIQLLHAANGFFEGTTPWTLKKSEDKPRLRTILNITMEVLRQAGIILQPIVPVMSGQLLDKLSVPRKRRLWSDLRVNFAITERSLMGSEAILFRRIVAPKEENVVKKEPKMKKIKQKN